MANGVAAIAADKEKLQAILSEKGLPAKLGATMKFAEWKIHELLCATYNFTTGVVVLEMPRATLQKCSPEIRKVWNIRLLRAMAQGKVEVEFSLTDAAIKTTLKTTLTKDAGILKAKANQVRLHESWVKHLKVKPKKVESVDFSKHEEAARRHNAAVTEQILDGKTFNAQKDNPWARKNLKNWKNQQN